MPINGLSTDTTLSTEAIQQIAAAGRTFVFRYYCAEQTQNPDKILRPAEAQAYADAKLLVGAVYEFGGGAPRFDGDVAHPEDFDLANADRDAQVAITQAAAVGQPAGTAIYFAVDNDFTDDDSLAKIIAYFARIANNFSQAGGATPLYTLGVYGSGYVCSQVQSSNAAVKYTWLAESTGWTGSADYTGWTVKQIIANGAFPDLDYEDCEAPGAFGGFTPVIGGAAPPLIVAADGGDGWTGILATASTAQTLARAQQGLGRGTVYQLGQGGEAADIPEPLTAECDCSGFVCWSIGVPRECPPGSDHWLYTDNIWAGGGDVGAGLFVQVDAGSAQPGDFYVYPSPSANEHGHISIVTSVQDGVPQQIIHCSLSNYENTNDAVRVTDPHIFEQNSTSRIVRPDYAAIQAAAGLS